MYDWFGPSGRSALRAWTVRLGGAGALLACGAVAAAAQAWWDETKNGIPDISIATSLPHNGDPGGIRKWLSEKGIVYGLEYTNDILSNVSGGTRTGTIDQGKFHGILTVDLEKLAGLQGLSFFTNVFGIHNTGRMRRDYVGGMNTIAAIEAVPTIRLSELWLEQKFLGDKASFRIGQLTADSEFFFSELSQMFLQSDWPTIAAVNLPSGGAAYPLSTPGVRLKFDPTKDVSFLFAVLNGDPAGPGPGDEQLRNRYGLNFRVTDPPFLIGEAQWRRNMDKNDTGLASTVKVGGWAHLGAFNDQRFANDGTLLANPLGSGIPLQHRGDLGLYAVIDQQLYRPKGAKADDGISVFSRMSIGPSDRNLVDRYIDSGIIFAGFTPGRPDDRFGVSAIYAHFSDSVAAFDRDTIAFTGSPGVVRDFEANLEFTYVAQIVPGWTVQPVVTRVWHPNGDASRNALVMGMRSLWRY
jgi:porin